MDNFKNDNNPGKPEETKTEMTVNLISSTPVDDGVSMSDVIRSFKRHSIRVLVVSMISLLIGVASAVIYYNIAKTNTGISQALLSYSYKGIENGLDPMGRPLDVSKVKSSFVIDKAMQELGIYDMGITVEDVRSNIVIEGVLPEDVMQRILIIKEIMVEDPTNLEAMADLHYYSTQYVVTLERRDELNKLNDKQLTELTNCILAHYTDYFIEEYSDRYIVDTISESFDQSQYDYFEVVQILNSQVNNMITYCEVKRNASPDFRSPVTQMTFGDIITNLQLIRSVDINRISALVYATNMSRDRDRLIKLYEYSITRMTMDMNVALENSRMASEKAESYQKDTALVLGTLGESATVNQPSNVYDGFLENALAESKKAKELEEEIAFYQTRLNALSPKTTQNDDGETITTPVAETDNSRDVKFVEDAIPSILVSLRNWAEITNQTVDDYLVMDAFKDATKVAVPAQFQSAISQYYKQMVIVVAAVTFIGFFFAFLFSIWKAVFPDKKC